MPTKKRQMSSPRVPPPPAARTTYPVNSSSPSPSFMSTIVQGMAFGAGSEVGHRVVDNIFSKSSASNINDAKTTKTAEPISNSRFKCDEEFSILERCVSDDQLYRQQLYENYINCMKAK